MKNSDDLVKTNDNDNIDDNMDNEFKTYYEDEDSKKRFPSFILLCLITTFGVMLALGLSFSAVKLIDSNETINTLISSLTGNDKDKYIITYVENVSDNNSQNNSSGRLYISSADFYNSTNNSNGIVTYYGGMMLTTKTTFQNNNSKVTYKIIITNDSSSPKTFEQLFYNPDTNVKYTLTGIKKGDIVGPSKSVEAYITLEYTSNDNSDFPKEVETNSNFSFEKNDGILHIIDANVYKVTNDGQAKVIYYGGMMLETENTFNSKSSTITYKVTIKNDSDEVKRYNGINYNTNGNVKYTISGIEEGDYFSAGESKVVYITIEYIGEKNVPITIETATSLEFVDFGASYQENGIYLINQFPTRDEIGKLFHGRNYVFNFALLIGKKTAGAYYELTAVPGIDNTLNPSYVKLYLEKNGKGVDMSYRENGRVKVFTEYKASDNPGTEGRLIYKDTVTETEAKSGRIDFVMRMWVTEDLDINSSTTDFFNKKFSAKVNTYAMYPNK